MTRPQVIKVKEKKCIEDYPIGPSYNAGNIVEKNEGWRTEAPEINLESCIGCYQCYMYCPEGVIYKTGKKVAIDYEFCKGCGICKEECPVNAIVMKREMKIDE